MATITRITTQKKHKNRFNIYLDQEYGFSVDEDVLIAYRLQKGLQMDFDMVAELIQKDAIHKSYNAAIHYLSYRMRTKKEISDYLAKKDVDDEHIRQVIDKLLRERLLDDAVYADTFVHNRIRMTDKGPILVKQELLEKGVQAEIAEKAVEQYTEKTQYEKAHKWATKKLDQGGKNAFRKQLQQVQQTLVQKGFSQDVIQRILSDCQEEKNTDAEWDALHYQGKKLIRKYQSKLDTGFPLRKKLKEALYRKGFSIEQINKFLDESMEKN